jgi:anti-anti-sigma factor
MLVAEGKLVLGHGADWEAWAPLVAATPGRVVRVDLSAVTDIDAAGVGLLMRLVVQARRLGRELAVVAASPRVRRVLELVQLDRLAGSGREPSTSPLSASATPARHQLEGHRMSAVI